jgi:hypothetical protein
MQYLALIRTGHKILEDVHEDSMQFPNQNSRFLCNRPNGLLWLPDAPQCLEASALQPSGRSTNTFRTLGQATPSSTRSWISVDTIWEVSTRRPNDVATRPDATQRSKIF